MGLRIGVDIGGSFTDFAVFNEESGSLHSLKVFSRPDQPGQEVLHGIQELVKRYAINPADIHYFTHGTTVGVNAVVQKKGAKLGLITNRYFEDVLALGRLKTPDMYNLHSLRPTPLVAREHVFGIDGRLDATGRELNSINVPSVLTAIEGLRAAGCEGVVIALLHAYRNPVHEKQVQALIEQAMPGFFVCCSSDVWPTIREFERTQTAVIGAYVQPRVAHYLGALQQALKQAGVGAELKVTKSNGGVMSAESGKAECVQMILSGTASGVMGAAWVARQCGRENVMSLDIGGTTADVALIVKGEAQYDTGEYIGDYQIHIPSVSVTSIGDGGGSVARVDEFGVLKVGPESAGSTPGPVCYGRGGSQPTITDAFVTLGILGQAQLGYNSVNVDVAAAKAAIGTLATQPGQSIESIAESIINVSVSGMYAGISRLVSRFGIDPRAFSLMPFGGAGPMMACYLARAMRMREILVPLIPGVLSALGGLVADVKNDFVRIIYCDLTADRLPLLEAEYQRLESQARDWLSHEVADARRGQFRLSAEMRYKGQSFEIETPLQRDDLAQGNLAALRDAFHQQHQHLYAYSDRDALIQVVSLRLVVSMPTPKPQLEPLPQSDDAPIPTQQIDVWMSGGYHTVPLYQRSQLTAGQQFTGPAVITQSDTTIAVLPDFHAQVDATGNLILTDLTHTAK
ncbi:hydantoinase/oxoprolinase family protein [Erwinia endophytica]|uniref:hydantoinase/oxoprolinase family protein n=1 Tax=Erwinia endophytica TaxID=1563158 RepID=UPI001265F17B|nr:hydantoinase/oxoprolinase family protein [Erwinia endophytica]KAB8308032.1 hydantoinase/oxoprolinase family protein [Erwinia endophytica]